MATEKDEFIVWQSHLKGKVLHNGQQLTPPEGWIFTESGDAGLTRRIKAFCEHWVMVRRRRNRIEPIGLWAPLAAVKKLRELLESERADPAYQKKLDAGKRSREAKQAKYEVEFRSAVLAFLAFSEKWSAFAEKLAASVTAHAIPVGSGTVARTQTIPVEHRAEAAVIAWMRHKTTVYDNMSIARIKGERREVRRKLAERSRQLLHNYRSGEMIDTTRCPLANALKVKA